jgi:hypothetical protein
MTAIVSIVPAGALKLTKRPRRIGQAARAALRRYFHKMNVTSQNSPTWDTVTVALPP